MDHVRLEDRIKELSKEGKTLPVSERLGDWGYHAWQLKVAALKVEFTCLAATELSEFAAQIGTSYAGYDQTSFWTRTACMAFGIACGYVTAVATHLHTPRHTIETDKPLTTVIAESLSAAYRGFGTLRRFVFCEGTPDYREERWQHIKGAFKHAVWGELFGCVTTGAVAENVITSMLGGNKFSFDQPEFYTIRLGSLIPAYLMASAVVALSYGYESHKQCAGMEHEH